jgi:large subunit ribosomal protein L25
MADITIEAERRNERGSGPAGRLRVAGKLPGVVYGKGFPAVSISVDHRIFRNTFNHVENRSETLTLMLDGVAHKVKIQDIARHPVKGTAAHVDFITV